jgi:hypothetical protein
MYIKLINGKPERYTLRQLREDNKDISFPAKMNDERYAEWGVFPYVETDKPDHDSATQVVENNGYTKAGGTYTDAYSVRDKTAAELADDTDEERTRKGREVTRAYSEAMEPLSKAYPAEEREGWAEQVEAAKEVVAGGQNDLIDTLREPTGETAQEMAEKILLLRGQYRVIYGSITAARRGIDLQIASSTTLAELQAVDVRAGFGLT